MLKVRVTFVNNGDELESFINIIAENYQVLEKSKIYKRRGDNKFNNIYFSIEKK